VTDERRGPAVVGLVLAAGGGSRYGRPKALVADSQGPWLERAVRVLRSGGCGQVHVVLGAAAESAEPLVGGLAGVSIVVASDWHRGMSASLLAGLDAVAATDADAVVITLVDLPDLDAAVVARLLDSLGVAPHAVGRAAYQGRPGHPVLLGREHWTAVAADCSGDRGARDYLDRIGAPLVECGDLASGQDVDVPARRRQPAAADGRDG